MIHATLIVTVKNEANTIDSLLESVTKQTVLPEQIIICDGGSSDETMVKLRQWQQSIPSLVVIQKIGNRSVGRNAAIEQAQSEIIVCTDAGCVLTPDWFSNITAPLLQKKADVVAGYYRAHAHTEFQKAAAAYMLVSPKRIQKKEFLPATRSMAFLKSAWKKVGGFPEAFDHNEDYVFAKELQRQKIPMCFAQSAIALWTPPSTWKSFLTQIGRFAFGDMEAGIVRPKVLFLFFRYLVFVFLFFSMPIIFCILFLCYVLWAIQKNRTAVTFSSAMWILPVMQISTDIIVMASSFCGIIARVFRYGALKRMKTRRQ